MQKEDKLGRSDSEDYLNCLTIRDCLPYIKFLLFCNNNAFLCGLSLGGFLAFS